MSAKPLIIAKLLPVKADNRQNSNLVQIRVKNITDWCQWDESSSDQMDQIDQQMDKPKRKRQKLDHLSVDEKIKRRYVIVVTWDWAVHH